MPKHPIVREIQQEIFDEAQQSGDPQKLGIIKQYMDGKRGFDSAIAEIEALDMAATQEQTRTFATVASKRDDNFTQLQRDWTDAQLVKAGLMQPDRDLGEVQSMTMLRFGERCLNERDAGMIERAEKQGIGVADILASHVRDWAETGAAQIASAFPLAVADIFSKSLSLGYSNAIEPLTFLANPRPVPNFMPHSMIQSNDVPELQTVAENGQIPQADMGDYAESGTLGTMGIITSISRQAIVNNETNSIAVNSNNAGKAAKQAEAAAIAAMLTGSYLTQDGNQLFSVAHGNLNATGAAPDVAGVDAVRAAMSLFTGPSGSTLNLYPAVMICGRNQEGVAATLRNAQYMPMQVALTPGYEPGSFAVVADGRITGNDWFMISDPRIHSGIEKLYLEGGDGGPYVEFFNQFSIDGTQAKVRHDFAIAAADYRSFYKVAVA